MAGGRDLTRRSPRWLDWLICSSGLAAAICFLWELWASDSDGSEALLGPAALLARMISASLLPALLLLTSLSRVLQRLPGRPRRWPSLFLPASPPPPSPVQRGPAAVRARRRATGSTAATSS